MVAGIVQSLDEVGPEGEGMVFQSEEENTLRAVCKVTGWRQELAEVRLAWHQR